MEKEIKMNNRCKKRVNNTVVSGQEREENDFYATYPIAVKYLLNKEKFARKVWECASGMNHIANVLTEYGYEVRTSDIVKRTKTTEVKDFLRCRWKWHNGDIITNPPFKYGQEFVEKALSLVDEGSKVAMLLPFSFADSLKRYNRLFKHNPPKILYIFSRRIRCAKGGDFSSLKSGGLQSYAWFVWLKGYKGKPSIDWINHDEELDDKRMRAPMVETTNKVITKPEYKEAPASMRSIIYYWNLRTSGALCLVNSLYSHETTVNETALGININKDNASITSSMYQDTNTNGLLSAKGHSISMIPTTEWRVGIYEMPQCTARGTPQYIYKQQGRV